MVKTFPRTPRLVNRFTLGADPEFTFHTKQGRYTHAETLGMNTMTGFGCDMCGRVAEVRAYPSRFALEVVAGIMETLRWIPFVHQAGSLDWKATTCIDANNTCGGHLAFGRKRGHETALGILDDTIEFLLKAKLLNEVSFAARQIETKYGKPRDYRVQGYGFEYRTPPTCLDSPWHQYLVLVINKLLVYRGKPSLYNPKQAQEGVKELLEQYQNLDDDAAIALVAYNRMGPPVLTENDFKPAWGIQIPVKPYWDFNRTFFPSIIRPDRATIEELFNYFVKGTPLIPRPAIQTWEPFELPPDAYKIAVQPHSLGHLPDVGMNLLSKKYPVVLNIGNRFEIFSPIKLPEKEINRGLSRSVSHVRFWFQPGNTITINIPKGFNGSRTQCELLHDILAEGKLFPVAEYTKFDKVDWSKWLKLPEPNIERKLGRRIA
jgi:hypothetical protein